MHGQRFDLWKWFHRWFPIPHLSPGCLPNISRCFPVKHPRWHSTKIIIENEHEYKTLVAIRITDIWVTWLQKVVFKTGTFLALKPAWRRGCVKSFESSDLWSPTVPLKSKTVCCFTNLSSFLGRSKAKKLSNFCLLWFLMSEIGKNVLKISTFSAALQAFFNSLYFRFSLFITSFRLCGRFKCSHFLRKWKILLKISIRQIFERAFSVDQYFLTIPCFRPSLRTSFNPQQLWATLLSHEDRSWRFSNVKVELSGWRIGTDWTSEPEINIIFSHPN